MFERFTETARLALFFTRYETTELGGQQIEAEHLLLGLLRSNKGPTPRLFAAAKLSYNEARATIQTHWGVRQKIPVSEEIPFSDQTARILQHASEEADRLLHPYVGTGHLLLGVLRESGSFAAGLLTQHGMTVERLRDDVAEPSGVPEPPPEAPTEGVGVQFTSEPFNAVVSLERIRVLVESLWRSEDEAESRGLVDQIHYHLDALKRHLA